MDGLTALRNRRQLPRSCWKRCSSCIMATILRGSLKTVYLQQPSRLQMVHTTLIAADDKHSTRHECCMKRSVQSACATLLFHACTSLPAAAQQAVGTATVGRSVSPHAVTWQLSRSRGLRACQCNLQGGASPGRSALTALVLPSARLFSMLTSLPTQRARFPSAGVVPVTDAVVASCRDCSAVTVGRCSTADGEGDGIGPACGPTRRSLRVPPSASVVMTS